MAFHSVKRALECAVKYECTINMLYLDGLEKVVTTMDDVREYDGNISSCIDIATKLCTKHRPVKVANILHERYKMDMSHVHCCISIYLGRLGTMDDEYIRTYPESNLSALGSTLTSYNSLVKDTMALAKLVMKAKLPQYKLDSFSVVYKCKDHVFDLDEKFAMMKEWIEIALQYGPSRSIFMSYNGDVERIRRRISVAIGKNIPKRYVEFTPKTVDKDGMIMARWNRKDFKLFSDKLIFDCDGKELDNVANYANEAVSAFGIDEEQMIFAHQTNSKASLKVDVDNWNPVVLEDLIINSHELSRVLTVVNGVLDEEITDEMLHKNRSLVIYIIHPRVRCAFRCKDGTLRVSIASHCMDDTAIVIAVATVSTLLKKYHKNFASAYERYSLDIQKSIKKITGKSPSRIDDLRKRLPELFANNYTRECHNLPIMLDTSEEADEYLKMGRLVIKYPLHGKYSRWYTSPSDELYVGLKLNRLSNKEKFKYIITCYSSNHYENPNRETYIYYRGNHGTKRKNAANLITLRILSEGRQGPLPIAMNVEYALEGYARLGTGGPFLDCIAYALGVDAKKFPKLVRKGIKNGLLNVVRQEMWSENNQEILEGINDDLDGTKYYRLFEEVYECNILLVEIGHRDKYNISIPSCRGKYIWEPREGKYIVVMKNEKKLYEDRIVSYELVVKKDKTLFGKKDPLVMALVSLKLSHTIQSDVNKDVQAQYINEYGKCNIVMVKNKMIKCSSRPLYKPTLDVEVVRKKSILYNYLGDIPLSSTAKHLYFPNSTSFMDWWEK